VSCYVRASRFTAFELLRLTSPCILFARRTLSRSWKRRTRPTRCRHQPFRAIPRHSRPSKTFNPIKTVPTLHNTDTFAKQISFNSMSVHRSFVSESSPPPRARRQLGSIPADATTIRTSRGQRLRMGLRPLHPFSYLQKECNTQKVIHSKSRGEWP
jgi:hypothetical protein